MCRLQGQAKLFLLRLQCFLGPFPVVDLDRRPDPPGHTPRRVEDRDAEGRVPDRDAVGAGTRCSMT